MWGLYKMVQDGLLHSANSFSFFELASKNENLICYSSQVNYVQNVKKNRKKKGGIYKCIIWLDVRASGRACAYPGESRAWRADGIG